MVAFLREASIARQKLSETSKRASLVDGQSRTDGQSFRALSAPLASPDGQIDGQSDARIPTSPARFPWSGLISVEEAEVRVEG